MNNSIHAVNDATAEASKVVQAGRDAAHRGIDQTASSAERAIDRGAPAAEEAVKRTGDMAHAAVDRLAESAERGAGWVRRNGELVRTRVDTARDRTSAVVRDDPIKSVLIAAAAGAIAYAVLNTLSGRSDR